ncbi:hypothetical protein LUZ63_003769 [Rhynchospora breviuscula]|uniref:KIB1-4 beta-propeller domain-containing protein n=1 Tax=Rhynchospora breviuscula TaxID=2022672 RepID=A0A9Q0D192_9POAL|nr:hypothetical protein LUZ63_003769 [Rhynchospora breviuscula]
MDWAGLFPELLDAILGKLTEFTDHLHFRYVCCSWQFVARSHPAPLSLPWLYLPHDPTSTDLRFYSFLEDRVHKISFPEVYNSNVIGSASGFLLVVRNSYSDPRVLIINPFTGTRAHLPNTTLLSPNTIWDCSGSVVVAQCLHTVAYCRPGDHSWTGIEALTGCSLDSIIYKAGSFHLLEHDTAKIFVLDGETLELTRIIQPPEFDHKFYGLVLSSDGLLFFSRLKLDENAWFVPVLFNVKSHLELEELSWSKLTNGNYMLVYDSKISFLCEASRYTEFRNTLIRYRLVDKRMGTHDCFIIPRNLGNPRREEWKGGKCRCSSYPSWILPS